MRKLLLTILSLSSSLASSGHVDYLNCSNKNYAVLVLYDQGPRGADLVQVDSSDGTSIEFTTKFSFQRFNTRCGIETLQTAVLYINNHQTMAKGDISIYTKGEDCGLTYSQATLELEVNDQQVKESLLCL